MCPDRLLPDTRLQDFMHENLCLKHGIKPSPPSKVMNKITYAKLFERFAKVSGMTGTAQESSSSFWEHYGLSVRRSSPSVACRPAMPLLAWPPVLLVVTFGACRCVSCSATPPLTPLNDLQLLIPRRGNPSDRTKHHDYRSLAQSMVCYTLRRFEMAKPAL